MAYELHAQASDEDRANATSWVHRALDMSEAELHGRAAFAYFMLAKEDRRLVSDAEEHVLHRLANFSEGQGRNRVFSQIRLASVRFMAGEAEQACDDGDQAIDAAEHTASTMIKIRLRELLKDSEPYADVSRVVEFRDRLRAVIARFVDGGR